MSKKKKKKKFNEKGETKNKALDWILYLATIANNNAQTKNQRTILPSLLVKKKKKKKKQKKEEKSGAIAYSPSSSPSEKWSKRILQLT